MQVSRLYFMDKQVGMVMKRGMNVKKVGAAIASFLVFALTSCAYADKARSIKTEQDSIYHAQHLELHVMTARCACMGNYVKVKTGDKEARVVGHLEQADVFELVQIENKKAYIRVVQAAATSPDSWNGMEGWVNTDYIECTCTGEEYIEAKEETRSFIKADEEWDSFTQILDIHYDVLSEEWASKENSYLFYEPQQAYWMNRENTGYMIRDIDGNGIEELLILDIGGEVYKLFVLSNGKPVQILQGWARNTIYLSCDGGFVNHGSDGAAYSRDYLFDLGGTELIVREGVISDYDEVGQEELWFYTEDWDLNTANDKLITRDEAFAYIERFEAMRDFNPGGITLFTDYNREDRP